MRRCASVLPSPGSGHVTPGGWSIPRRHGGSADVQPHARRRHGGGAVGADVYREPVRAGPGVSVGEVPGCPTTRPGWGHAEQGDAVLGHGAVAEADDVPQGARSVCVLSSHHHAHRAGGARGPGAEMDEEPMALDGALCLPRRRRRDGASSGKRHRPESRQPTQQAQRGGPHRVSPGAYHRPRVSAGHGRGRGVRARLARSRRHRRCGWWHQWDPSLDRRTRVGRGGVGGTGTGGSVRRPSHDRPEWTAHDHPTDRSDGLRGLRHVQCDGVRRCRVEPGVPSWR